MNTLKRLSCVVCLLVLAFVAGCPKPTQSTSANSVFQRLSFDQALQKAEADHKLVMIDFYTDWCVYCKQLDGTTWRDPKVQDWIRSETVALKIDAEGETKLANKYNVRGYPTIVFLNPDGSEVYRIGGYKDANDFLAEVAPLRK
jgi:thiol:disulfide interchange protein DsbD